MPDIEVYKRRHTFMVLAYPEAFIAICNDKTPILNNLNKVIDTYERLTLTTTNVDLDYVNNIYNWFVKRLKPELREYAYFMDNYVIPDMDDMIPHWEV